jgi:small-conductance mechanosensitive channel
MAKYVIDTELNNRALSAGVRGINQQMNSLTRSARDFNKEFEKSGKKSDKKKAMQDMAQAISLADEKVKKLTADLEAMQAKGNIKGITKAEADLRNAKTQAAALRREMEAMNKSAGGGVTGFARLKAAKDAAMNSKPCKYCCSNSVIKPASPYIVIILGTVRIASKIPLRTTRLFSVISGSCD